MPIGGRTASMGGAGVAAGNDSAMPYLNPAGLGGVPGDIFALSGTVYAFTERDFEDFFFPNGIDPGLEPLEENTSTVNARSVSEVPSSVMYFAHLTDPDELMQQLLGIALVIPSDSRLELLANYDGSLPRLNGSIQNTIAIDRRTTDYYFGPSYALSWDDSVHAGVSLFAYYVRAVETVASAERIEIAGGASSSASQLQLGSRADSLGAVPIAGLQVLVGEDFWIGASIAAPSIHISGKRIVANESTGLGQNPDSGLPYAQFDTLSLEADYRADSPLRVSVGAAYDDRTSFSIAGDVHYFAERKDAIQTTGVSQLRSSRTGWVSRDVRGEEDIRSDLIQMVDLSLGIEVVTSDVVALRAGGFADMANTPSLNHPDTSDARRLRADRFGGTLGLGLTFGSFDTTLGVLFAQGQGKYVVLDSISQQALETGLLPTAIDMTERTAMFFLSGAVTTEEAQETIRNTLPVPVDTMPDLPGRTGPTPSPGYPPPDAPPAPPPVAPPAPPPVAPPAPPPPEVEPEPAPENPTPPDDAPAPPEPPPAEEGAPNP